ncbi:hypothetical protein AVEN_132368-1 [Araneus ventricosus]|uniref:Uncharacterized protein n=1 Tax=Araneus ventricosus TaxID=182803 RepID=A0A4Y2NHC7_ARAVE|nr:hypothetical protein AVEN_132368-1 [Araneus ventricosus]
MGPRYTTFPYSSMRPTRKIAEGKIENVSGYPRLDSKTLFNILAGFIRATLYCSSVTKNPALPKVFCSPAFPSYCENNFSKQASDLFRSRRFRRGGKRKG